MHFGLQQSNLRSSATGNRWDAVHAVAQVCDEEGFDSFWIPDHFQYGTTPVLECWVTLGALAATTGHIQLGALVSGVPYRNPALLAKMGTTLDVISHGRAILGIGSAWHREEFDAYGFDFGTTAERGGRLDEAAQIIRSMLSQQRTSFVGRYYRVHEAINEPQPLRQPHPPLLIGGNGERVTLRLVARYADMCNVTGTPEEARRLFAVLRQHCAEVGRAYEEITRTTLGWCLIGRTDAEVAAKRERFMAQEDFPGIAGTPQQIVARLREYAAAGSQGFLFSMPDGPDLEPLRLFAREVIPALHTL